MPIVKPTLANKLSCLAAAFVVMLWLVGMSQYVIGLIPLGARDLFLISSVLQSLFAFMFPAWLVARLCSGATSEYLGTNRTGGEKPYWGILILYLLMLPALNFVVDWNANLHFPAGMESMEAMMRGWEERAAGLTDTILSDPSIWGLISGVLIVGCLTGLSEEMFFRAGLQKAMTSSGVNRHLAIWISALVFSAVHFQFFGFVPRLLLGALFGYLYFYSGSIWVSASAHAFNNSLVVISAWLSARGIASIDIDTIGVAADGFPWVSLMSLILTVLFVAVFGKTFFCHGPAKRS